MAQRKNITGRADLLLTSQMYERARPNVQHAGVAV